jgi:predicted RND superfamily exporter protein
MWNAIATFCIRNRFVLLIVLGLMTGVFGYYATKVKMTYDNAKIIPNDDPDHQDYLKFKQMFGEDGNILVIGVQSSKIF